MGWNESDLLGWLKRELAPRGILGRFGHDGAFLRWMRANPVVCCDQTVEGVHDDPETPPELIGRKAASRALSDLAACAARPRAILLALSLDAERSGAYARGLIRGVARRSRELGAELVGGDLCQVWRRTALCVTAIGESKSKRPPQRSGARAGQWVLLSGPTGGSRLGRHLRFNPRVALGAWLHARGATALMDVSDGLALDLWRMAESSRVRIDLEHIPIHPDAKRAGRLSGRSPAWHALNDGEDYELIATLAPARAREVLRSTKSLARRGGDRLQRIGTVRRGHGLFVREGESWKPFEFGEGNLGGWMHGISP